jgi:peptidoglycan hydrolase-like protein with peptidoglycan-binding domain
MLHPMLRLLDGSAGTSPELGDEVKVLQTILKQDGFAVDVDGVFGPETESAVKRFQAEHGVADDGVVGPGTWAALTGTSPPADPASVLLTTYAPNNASLLAQLNEATKYKAVIGAAAAQSGLSAALIGGIGSRESGWGLTLKPAGPGGTGDLAARRAPTQFRTGPLPPDGLGYGRGLMQIDYDSQELARTGNWQDPTQNIPAGCKILTGFRDLLQRRTSLTGADLIRAAVASYNSGPGRVLTAIQSQQDVDFFTAGRDYSKDVLNRAGWFQLKGWTTESVAARAAAG